MLQIQERRRLSNQIMVGGVYFKEGAIVLEVTEVLPGFATSQY